MRVSLLHCIYSNEQKMVDPSVDGSSSAVYEFKGLWLVLFLIMVFESDNGNLIGITYF